MDRLIRFALRNRALVLAAAMLLLFFGGWSALRMPVDVFPDLTAPTVTVITDAHGMAPTEVETQVTFPIETALNGASRVRRVRSSTTIGLSVVYAEFEWGTDLMEARQIVNERLATVVNELPPEVMRPVLAPASSIMGEVLFLGLTSTNLSPVELHTYSKSVVRRRLLSVPGVSQVTPSGGADKQFQVVLSPARLAAHGLSLTQVMRALEESNENVAAGVINERGSEWLVSGYGRFRTLDDIRATVVTARNAVPVTVGDIAEVRAGPAPVRGQAAVNGREGVVLGIQKQPGANTVALTRALDTVLDDIQAKLPPGVALHRDLFRQADFIQRAVRNVQTALLEGVALVVVVVLVFLANGRATFITVTAIPLSLVAAVLVLEGFGATINTMTLGGMAIAIGALVDDAVIDVENVFRRLRENSLLPEGQRRPALQVVLAASVEIRSSIVFATLIIALVFTPLFFLSGVEGRLMAPLGLAYLVALVASLFVAVTVTPVLCSLLLPRSRAVQGGHEPRWVRWLKARYAAWLAPVLRHPWRLTLPVLALLAGVLVSTRWLGRAFLPDFNEGSLTITTVTLPGTSLPESDRLASLVDKTLLAFPEVVSVGRRTGRGEADEHGRGVEGSELEVSLKMRQRGKEELLDAMRRGLGLIPGLNVTLGQPISHRIDHMLSGTRASIAVKIFGPDLYKLREIAGRAREAMSTVAGVVDLSVEPQMDIPVLRVQFDRPALARHGLAIREAARHVEAAIQGVAVSRILENQLALELVVKLQDDEPWRTDTLDQLLVDTPSGARAPLSTLARVTKDSGPNAVSREQVERKIVVSSNVTGRDVTSVVRDIEKRVSPLVRAVPGYRVEYGGQFESAAAASRVLFALGLAVIIGIGFLLQLAFGSARDAALIMLNLPLALIGGVAGVFVSGGVLSVASLIGFITVFGIATRNGIMLVSHIRHLQTAEGVTDFAEAVARGARERLVPILMTALAAGLALIPLAVSGDQPGNEIQTPMAIVILFGLLSSMLLNMFIVPALYLRFAKPTRLNNGGAQ